MRGDCHESKFNFTVGVMDRSPSITIRPHFMPIFVRPMFEKRAVWRFLSHGTHMKTVLVPTLITVILQLCLDYGLIDSQLFCLWKWFPCFLLLLDLTDPSNNRSSYTSSFFASFDHPRPATCNYFDELLYKTCAKDLSLSLLTCVHCDLGEKFENHYEAMKFESPKKVWVSSSRHYYLLLELSYNRAIIYLKEGPKCQGNTSVTCLSIGHGSEFGAAVRRITGSFSALVMKTYVVINEFPSMVSGSWWRWWLQRVECVRPLSMYCDEDNSRFITFAVGSLCSCFLLFLSPKIMQEDLVFIRLDM